MIKTYLFIIAMVVSLVLAALYIANDIVWNKEHDDE